MHQIQIHLSNGKWILKLVGTDKQWEFIGGTQAQQEAAVREFAELMRQGLERFNEHYDFFLNVDAFGTEEFVEGVLKPTERILFGPDAAEIWWLVEDNYTLLDDIVAAGEALLGVL